MIEIKCNKEEKERIINAFVENDLECIFSIPDVKCSEMNDCEECLEKNIKWIVK